MTRTGKPGLAAWTPYRLPERATLLIGEEKTSVVDDPRRWQRELWATGPYIQPGS